MPEAPLTPAVLIPAYQAASSLAGVIDGVRAALPGVPILVVDDGSTDGTGKVARAAGVDVITHLRNRGKGDALRTGFGELAGRCGAVITLDADGQHEPSEIPALLARLGAEGADICVGTRMGDTRTMPPVRRLANRAGSAVLGWLAGARLEDTQSGYRVYRASALPALMDAPGRGYDFESGVLIRACRLGMLVVFESVTTRYGDEKSHFRPFRDGFRFLRLVAASMPGMWARRRGFPA
ncbi:MAG: glycosyltransferase family 2 protein [Candidatus Eisenbacteria bacterium]|nr:glycosyltransferase family 2 protein [Candidatus Eisenbacteria bacterium]